MTTDDRFHPLQAEGELPQRLNNPFSYEPHPLALLAAALVRRHVASHPEWAAELAEGKMLGVLVCRDGEGRLGFLAAYSGQMGGREDWPWFVPAVFDYLQADGYFKREEAAITAINQQIARREQAGDYVALKARLSQIAAEAAGQIADYRELMSRAKARRDALRAAGSDGPSLTRESQFQKAELHRLKQHWQALTAQARAELAPAEQAIARLRQERRQRSDALQRWLFDQFVMRSVTGEQRTLTSIFAPTPQRIPPSGAGECCAPKLLQYAFLHGMQPLQIAEFWQGASPKAEVRHDGQFYPACRGKCKPILEWMLGVGPPRPPLGGVTPSGFSLHPSYREARDTPPSGGSLHPPYREARGILPSGGSLHPPKGGPGGAPFIVVDKPAGLLSVPGKTAEESVESLLRQTYGQVFMVHRLDQDTSGLMVVALTAQAYHHLQRQFLEHAVSKTYVALIEHRPATTSGTISLPLRPALLDRPRQLVDHQHGKQAVTDYEVGETDPATGYTRIVLHPRTGRTHQLRMHCAHQEGLDSPIVGDRLYGHSLPAGSQQRLCLHAAELSFLHPVSGQRLHYSSPAPF